MMGFIASLSLPEIVGGVMMIALNAYVLMGGADFGGGVWDLLASGPRREAQRTLIAESIGPIWEANHVWLVIVVVMLFTAFPTVFALLGTVLHIPLTLMLVGIVLRGSAFVFRSYGSRAHLVQRRWGRVFSGASLITPILLGVIVGAIASGAVGRVQPAIASPALGGVNGAATFQQLFVAPWFGVFPFAVGVLALVLFAFLAAVYLTLATGDDALREDFRRRALGAAIAAFAAAAGSLLVAHVHAPAVGRGLVETPLALALQGATALAALTAIGALYTRRWQLARLAAGAQVSLVLWGWVMVQYPYIVPRVSTLRDAAAPAVTLELLLTALAIGAVVLIPSLVYLFRSFGAARGEETEQSSGSS